jgi:hypothetical protein
VALQYLKDFGRLTYRRFLELFRHIVGLLGRVISPSQDLYLHRTTQHRKTRTNIHALSGIHTHDPSNQQAKTHAKDRTAIVTGAVILWPLNKFWSYQDSKHSRCYNSSNSSNSFVARNNIGSWMRRLLIIVYRSYIHVLFVTLSY